MPGTLSNPRFWIGIAISIVALIVLVIQVDIGEATNAFRRAQYGWLLPAIALSVGSLLARAVRWQVLFHPESPPYHRMFGFLAVGYTVTTILPLRLGDIARIYLVGELQDLSKARAASTILVERILDIVTVLVILLVLLPLTTLPPWVRAAMWVGAGVTVAGGGIIAWSWFKRGQAQNLVTAGLTWLPDRWVKRIREVVDSLIDGFSLLSSPAVAARAVGWSAATWLSGAGLMWVMLQAFDLPASGVIAMFLLAVSAVSMVIPSSPGFVGVYHALIIEALVALFGIESGPAASFAITTHLLLFIPPVLIGVAYLAREQEIWDTLLEWGGSRN